MRLCRVVHDTLIHEEIDLPPLINKFIVATGSKGLACDKNYGYIFQVERWNGNKEDITCPECIALIEAVE